MRLLLLLYCLCSIACTRGEFGGVEFAGDTTRLPQGMAIGKLKARTVVVQMGQGNTAAPVDNTQAGQKNGSAATAPGAVASTTTKEAGLPWWIFVLVGVLSVVSWEYISHQGLLKWLPWRGITAILFTGLLSQCRAPMPTAGPHPPHRPMSIEQAQRWRARNDTPDKRNRRYYRAYPR